MYFWFLLLEPLLILTLLPYPQHYQFSANQISIKNKCGIIFQINDYPNHIQELIRQYKRLFFQNDDCKNNTINTQQQFQIYIKLEETTQFYFVNETNQESYTIDIDQYLKIRVTASNHWGLARALATLHQLFNQAYINLPLNIIDQPSISMRGVMIDTSRHYLPLDLLKQTIDSLMLNKLNVLHWHLSDDESFPLQLNEYRIITDTSKYDQNSIYSKEDVTTLIEYASIRGVQIIPEIDSPAHTRSWGQNPDISRIVIDCTSVTSQLDPANETTYQVLESIMNESQEMFNKTQFFHFGGDEADDSCYDKKLSVIEFMKQKGMNTYYDLNNYYRKRQKNIWRQKINPKKRIIYWYNKKDKLLCDQDDIIQWWGLPEDLACVSHFQNDFILSYYHPLYLDVGDANAFGDQYDRFQTWKDIYTLQLKPPKNFQGKILGFILPLWGETNNIYTHFQKLYPRLSVLADILWNENMRGNEEYYNFANRLGEMENFMIQNGYTISPFTSQFCKKNTNTCFYQLNRQIKNLSDTCVEVIQVANNQFLSFTLMLFLILF